MSRAYAAILQHLPPKHDKGGDSIGRVIIIELKDQDSSAFDEILDVLQRYPELNRLEFDSEPVLSLPNIEIYPKRNSFNYDEI